MNKKIVGVFYTEHEASRAIEDLKNQGFLTEDISVIARNKDDVDAINNEMGTKAPEGMASGAALRRFAGRCHRASCRNRCAGHTGNRTDTRRRTDCRDIGRSCCWCRNRMDWLVD